MICRGCGNKRAAILKVYYEDQKRVELCDDFACGNLRSPLIPDVYFREPYFDPNLANEKNPQGVQVESRRHKAHLLREQGLKEGGDRYHGSLHRGAAQPKRKMSASAKAKLRHAVRKNLGVMKRRP